VSYTGFWWGDRNERDHLVDPGVDRRIILNKASESGKFGYGMYPPGSVYRQAWTLVPAVMKLLSP
jgi:hypothetical protein